MRLRTLLIVLVLALLVPQAASAAPGEITTFPLPAGATPEGIAAGPEGSLWFAERGLDRIGRVTPGGDVTEYPLPTANAQPSQIAAGADGNMWFTESRSGNVGRITPLGVVTEFQICDEYCAPWGITAGPEGDVWVALAGSGEVARVTASGAITRFPLDVGANTPAMIATGSDGNLWIADKGLVEEEPTIGQVVRLTPSGQATSFLVPTPVENFRPTAIAAGPDGAIWFSGSGVGVGRVDTSGSFSEFPVPQWGESDAMTAGPDGDVWFAMSGGGAHDGWIDRITPDGHLTTYSVPYGSRGVTVGAEGDIWFTEWVEGKIGRLAPGASGLEVTAGRGTAHGARVRVPLYCGGGSATGRCAGTLMLKASVKVTSGGPITHRRITIGSAHYSLADGTRGTVAVRLFRKRLKRARHGSQVRTEAFARGSAGVGTRRAFDLSLPRIPG
ncbi:MAG: hypothetical protein QM729_03435 [Solirubrobacterales bacterium]